MVLSIRGEKESSLTYSNNTYTDVTLDLGAAAVADPLRSNTPSSGIDRVIGIEAISPETLALTGDFRHGHNPLIHLNRLINRYDHNRITLF